MQVNFALYPGTYQPCGNINIRSSGVYYLENLAGVDDPIEIDYLDILPDIKNKQKLLIFIDKYGITLRNIDRVQIKTQDYDTLKYDTLKYEQNINFINSYEKFTPNVQNILINYLSGVYRDIYNGVLYELLWGNIAKYLKCNLSPEFRVQAASINFLLISDGSCTWRYST